ncbi:MAG: hypothetical protein GWN86_27850, partial [Desulfobacterales bacterium]|nr:hypothetical protein [Desulfobacterales bacterium]
NTKKKETAAAGHVKEVGSSKGSRLMSTPQAKATERVFEPGMSLILEYRHRCLRLMGTIGMLYIIPRMLSPAMAKKIVVPR